MDAEAGELVVLGVPRFIDWLEGFRGALGQRSPHLRGAFSCTRLHGVRVEAINGRVSTKVNTRKEPVVDLGRRCTILTCWLSALIPVIVSIVACY